MSLRRAFGQLLLDDTPVEKIAKLIHRDCKRHARGQLDSVAKCRICKAKVPITEISICTLRENRRGHFGTCLACEKLQKDNNDAIQKNCAAGRQAQTAQQKGQQG